MSEIFDIHQQILNCIFIFCSVFGMCGMWIYARELNRKEKIIHHICRYIEIESGEYDKIKAKMDQLEKTTEKNIDRGEEEVENYIKQLNNQLVQIVREAKESK